MDILFLYALSKSIHCFFWPDDKRVEDKKTTTHGIVPQFLQRLGEFQLFLFHSLFRVYVPTKYLHLYKSLHWSQNLIFKKSIESWKHYFWKSNLFCHVVTRRYLFLRVKRKIFETEKNPLQNSSVGQIFDLGEVICLLDI